METMARILGFILLLSCSAFFFLEAVALSSHSIGLAVFSLILAIVIFNIGLTLFRGLPLLQTSLRHARRENPSPWPRDGNPKKLSFWNAVSNAITIVALTVLTAIFYVYSAILLGLWLLKREIRMGLNHHAAATPGLISDFFLARFLTTNS